MEAKTKSAKSGKTEIMPAIQNKADWNLFPASAPGLKYSLDRRNSMMIVGKFFKQTKVEVEILNKCILFRVHDTNGE